MTDPIRNAKPVGPPPPPRQQRPPAAAPASGQQPSAQQPPPPTGDPTAGQPHQPGPRAQPAGAYFRSYSWSSSRRSIPWLAILLLVLGVGLLVELLIPQLSLVSLIILAGGIAFGAAWLLGRFVGATVPALVLLAWGISRMATELDYLAGDGWTSLFVGIAFLVAWGLGRFQKVRREWALFVGAILGIIGLADVSDTLSLGVDMFVVIPLALIGVGLYLIVRDRIPAR